MVKDPEDNQVCEKQAGSKVVGIPTTKRCPFAAITKSSIFNQVEVSDVYLFAVLLFKKRDW